MTVLSNQVLATIAYCDQFQFPLTLHEIRQRLIVSPTGHPGRSAQTPAKLPTVSEVKACLEALVKTGQVVRYGLYFQLASSQSWLATREARQAFSQEKWLSVQQFVRRVRKWPWILGVAVTGSLAMNNATQAADIDFMLVTTPGRLWLTRLWVSLVAMMAGRRRSWHTEEPNSWCFNLWLDVDTLAMPKQLQSVYGAYEVVQAVWVFDRGGVEAAFIMENQWCQTFLPVLGSRLVSEQRAAAVTLSERGAHSSIWLVFENMAYWLQYTYMKRHMTREKVGKGSAFFHPRNTRKLVETTWQASLKQPKSKNMVK